MNRAVLLAVLLLPAAVLAQSAQDDAKPADDGLSSHLDYSDPAMRDRPIACRDGDVKRHAGESLGRLFGDAWPAAPANAAKRERATVEHWGKLIMPAGVAPKDATVVVATLVDANGEPQRAEAICTTDAAFDTSAARTVMRSRFTPARYDGTPAVGAAVVVVRYARGGALPGARRRP